MINSDSDTHYNVDEITVGDGLIFCSGWLFHEQLRLSRLCVVLCVANPDETFSIDVSYRRRRDDVSCAYNLYENSKYSGFLLSSGWASTGRLEKVSLKATFVDGSFFETNIPFSSIKFSGILNLDSSLVSKAWSIARQLRRAWSLVRAGQTFLLFKKIKKRFLSLNNQRVKDPSEIIKYIDWTPANGAILIVDHDLGGGANQYREKIASEFISEDRAVFILTYNVVTLNYVIILKTKDFLKRFSIISLDFIAKLLNECQFDEIIYNTSVSFCSPQKMPELLYRLKCDLDVRVKVLLHDYNAVCPSHFLLNYDGVFCGVPNVEECQRCISRSNIDFVPLFSERDIRSWRASWHSVLKVSDCIVAFSHSTLNIFKKVYPDLSFENATVKPHVVNYLKGNNANIHKSDVLCIGVMGHIGYHKGAHVVISLANEIRRRGENIQIVIIGSIEVSYPEDIVNETGSYNHDNLSRVIEESSANVFLFPSICPETFSYVVHELIDLNLPVVSFNLGAQAEKVSKYARGLVVDFETPSDLLDVLLEFHKNIYLEN